MAYKANDGSSFTNRGGMVKQNSKLAAKAPAKAPAAAPMGQVDDGVNADAGQEIMQDPQAMQALDVLVQKGYTSEEISQAVEQLQGAGEPDGDEGQMGGAAPSGMMG